MSNFSSHTCWFKITCQYLLVIVKRPVKPKIKMIFFPLTCEVITQFRLSWCKLQGFGANGCRDLPPLECTKTKRYPPCGAQNAFLNAFKNSAAMSLSKIYIQVSQDNPQKLLLAFSCRNHFLSTKTMHPLQANITAHLKKTSHKLSSHSVTSKSFKSMRR